MPDTKLSALTALAGSALAADDLLYVADTSVTTSKSIRADELLANLIVSTVTVGTGSASVTVTTKAPGSGAGNALTLSGSAAASGNSNGGDVILRPGAKSGSGADGQTRFVNSSGAVVAYITNAGVLATTSAVLNAAEAGTGFSWFSGLLVNHQAVETFWATATGGGLSAPQAQVPATGHFSWASAAFTNPVDTTLARAAAGVVRPTNGAGAGAWIQNTAGRARVATDVTNVSTTMAAITGLSVTLKAGRTYSFHAVILCEDVTAADGVKIDFNGGTATAADFEAFGTIDDTTAGRLATVATTTLDGDVAVTLATGPARIEVTGTITVTDAGTFVVRGAKNDDAAGAALTFKRGSYLWLEDMP